MRAAFEHLSLLLHPSLSISHTHTLSLSLSLCNYNNIINWLQHPNNKGDRDCAAGPAMVH